MQSGFINWIKNYKVGTLPEKSWKLLFENYIYKFSTSFRKGIINNIIVKDLYEKKIFSLKETGFPPLITKQWYIKFYRNGQNGHIFKCTIQNISFCWNTRNHDLYITYDYITEHYSTLYRKWMICN